jgi:hypothetical protein
MNLEQLFYDLNIADLFLSAGELMQRDNYLRIANSLRSSILDASGRELTPKEEDWVTDQATKACPEGKAAVDKTFNLAGVE